MSDPTIGPDDAAGKHAVGSPRPGDVIRDECDNCEYETDLTYYSVPPGCDGAWLCEVCASTFLGKATQYPRQVEDPLLYRSIGWIANRLLDEIRGMGKGKP